MKIFCMEFCGVGVRWRGVVAGAVFAVLSVAMRAGVFAQEGRAVTVEPRNHLFTTALPDFGAKAYDEAVGALMGDFEKTSGRSLRPGEQRRAGIKVYTASGPGIATPKNLVRAVVRELERRGFSRAGILIVDLHGQRLRDCGYLPALPAEGEGFEGSPVLVLDSGKYYNAQWLYENPLPSREIFARQGDYAAALALSDKHSQLPVPLLFQVDFWINLPSAMDSPALGVSGALANATLWNISNQRRFLDSPGNATKAAVEIAAIPELQRTLVFHLLTLERYQYAGAPQFDSNYCLGEKQLWLSANPLILDYLMLQRFNTARAAHNIPLIEPEPPMFTQGNTPPIQLGPVRPAQIHWHRVTAAARR
ncbi:MAG: DUF362 domain-containing protein [Puniceicoccales bacterium]|jgi:hypothetical protein|nr:DUF362 domain-containing protein [Puniceicoccales bacterium]